MKLFLGLSAAIRGAAKLIGALGTCVACGGVAESGTDDVEDPEGGAGTFGSHPSPGASGNYGVAGSDGSAGAYGVAGGYGAAGAYGDQVEPSEPVCAPPDDDGSCRMSQQLVLSAPYIREEDGDGKVEPGETIVVGAVLSNPGPLDHMIYPGIQVVADHPGFTPNVSSWNGFYAMFVGQSAEVGVELAVPVDAAVGTTVYFWIGASAINVDEPCCGLASLQIAAVVE